MSYQFFFSCRRDMCVGTEGFYGVHAEGDLESLMIKTSSSVPPTIMASGDQALILQSTPYEKVPSWTWLFSDKCKPVECTPITNNVPTMLEHDEHHHLKYVAHAHFEASVPLNQILSDNAMSEQRARDIFSQICYGLQHCHARKVAHW